MRQPPIALDDTERRVSAVNDDRYADSAGDDDGGRVIGARRQTTAEERACGADQYEPN